MSFFNNFKKSLGFGNDVDDELLEDSIEPVEAETVTTVSETVQDNPMTENRPLEIDRSKADMIFDHVVAVFNEALPAFLRDSVDSAAQRKKLYDGLDESLKEYIDSISIEAQRRCEAHWSAEQASMRNEMDNLRSKAKEIEQQRFDIKQQQLSSDRQRRALTDRLHDLEAQIARLEAEREQFDLENKSLLNKLKVAGVQESEIESLQQLLNDAKAEILRLRAGGNGVSSTDNEKVTELEAQNAALNQQLETAVEKDRISNEMINGLQSKASEAREENEQLKARITDLETKLKEAESYKAEIAEISKQVEQVEEVINKRDRKIEKLKDTCRSLQEENASLQQTIVRNLRAHADKEAELSRKIEELEADTIRPVITADLEAGIDELVEKASENTVVKISDGDLAAIEESFDSADWMRSDPPETPSMRSGVSEAEFGYQAPVRKGPRSDNDAQLSLF